MKYKTIGGLLLSGALVLGVSGCEGGAKSPEVDAQNGAEKTENMTVYASTDVWAAVARSVAGGQADVITSIDNSNQDPHSYEPSVNDKHLVSKAAVVLVNGGGYDDWAIQLAKSVEPQPTIINAVEVAGIDCDGAEENTAEMSHESEDTEHDHEHENEDVAHEHKHTDETENKEHADESDHDAAQGVEDADHAAEIGHDHEGHHHCAVNEHVFYDLDAVAAVAKKLAAALKEVDTAGAENYEANAAGFKAKLDDLAGKAAAIKTRGHKHSVATEPLANYLLEDIGVHDITPEDYVVQSETEAGPSVKVQAQMQELLESGEVNVLLVNAQTEDPVSVKLQETAQKQGIALVTLNETLAGAADYGTWISDALNQLDAALQ